MRNNSESQCYFVQLQIDSFLDGELSSLQQQEFKAHLQQCNNCARELHYAQTVHDAVLYLPQLECDEKVLEPVYRLGAHDIKSGIRPPASFWQQLGGLIDSIPVFVRVAVPAIFVGAVGVWLSTSLFSANQNQSLVATQNSSQQIEQYTPEEIYQALMDLNVAIEYLNDLGERTDVLIGNRFLVTPLQESLNASFEVMRNRNNGANKTDPVF